SAAAARLRLRYLEGLPERQRALQAALEAHEREPGEDSRRQLRALAHQLRGTAASFGLHEVDRCAHSLEYGTDDSVLDDARTLVAVLGRAHAAAITPETEILLIDDEIFAGFGRTGRWFAREHWGVKADLMTIGKGLTSGYAPLAGVLVSEGLAGRFDDEVLWCGLTHYAHPVSCAAAVGSMEVMEREDLVGNADRVGAVFERRFGEFVERHAAVVGHRGLGLMRALELDRDTAVLAEKAWELGLYLPRRGNLAFVCPPLCLRAEDAEEICDGLDRALASIG
ncbi:MAG: aminotransferase class III-fold pyridoxal phosphate-dependent enzyme, partial [Myxococcales bacterium]|nr:aminotransferase class III-fold pyridoxal phosphate-dependent enzyme [Myxococcales bacterium]